MLAILGKLAIGAVSVVLGNGIQWLFNKLIGMIRSRKIDPNQAAAIMAEMMPKGA